MYYTLNTSIPLKKLTQDNLDYILLTYNTVGLITPKHVAAMDVDSVVSGIKRNSSRSFELTPNIIKPDNKLIFSEKYGVDNNPYLHVSVIPNGEDKYRSKYIRNLFDTLIRDELL